MTNSSKTNKRIIRLGDDNYLLLIGNSIDKENMIEALTQMIVPTQGFTGRDSIFIDVGSLIKNDWSETMISIASLKLFVEKNEVIIHIDFREPVKGYKIKSEKDRFIIGEVELTTVIEDIVVNMMTVIDGYRKVVTYGC